MCNAAILGIVSSEQNVADSSVSSPPTYCTRMWEKNNQCPELIPFVFEIVFIGHCAVHMWHWTVKKRIQNSVAVLAEIPLGSPQKLFIFIIKKYICWLKVSKNKII